MSWFYADASGADTARERRIIAWAAVALVVVAVLAPLGFRLGG